MWAHLLVWLSQFWHSTFMVGAMSAFIPAAMIDYQAFKSFKNFEEFETYQWGTALWRWSQAIIVGGLAGTIFRGVVG